LKLIDISVQFAGQANRGRSSRVLCGTVLTFAALLVSLTSAAQLPVPALQLSKTIVLPGVTGRFDHLAVDTAGSRLFLAATGNHSVVVVDLQTEKVAQSLTGLNKPHGLAWNAATGSLYVSDGALGELRVYKGAPLALALHIPVVLFTRHTSTSVNDSSKAPLVRLPKN